RREITMIRSEERYPSERFAVRKAKLGAFSLFALLLLSSSTGNSFAGARGAVGRGVGSIDALPSLSINSVSDLEGDSGKKPFTFTVTLSSTTNQQVTVDFATSDGQARVTNNDY